MSMRRGLIFLLALTVLLGGACTEQTDATPTLDLDDLEEGEEIPEDIPEEDLQEVEPESETERLFAEASKTNSLCETWDRLDKMEQPEPGDSGAIVDHMEDVYNHLFQIDPTRKVTERVPAERGRPARTRQIELPERIVDDIETYRKAAFQYLVRVANFTGWHAADHISAAELDQRLQMAFARYTSEKVTQAQQRLIAFEATHC